MCGIRYTLEKSPCCGLCAAAPAQSTTNPGCVRITCSVMHFDFVLHVHLWLQTAVSVEHWAPSAQRKCCVCVQYTAVPAEAGRVRFEVSTVAFVMPWVGSEGLRRGHHECRSRSIQYDVCMFSNFDVPPIFVTWCSRRRFASLTGFLQGASERGKDSTDLPIRHDSGCAVLVRLGCPQPARGLSPTEPVAWSVCLLPCSSRHRGGQPYSVGSAVGGGRIESPSMSLSGRSYIADTAASVTCAPN